MCPICWATALASFGMMVVVSVVAVTGTDKWTHLLAAILGVVSLAHRWEFVTIPWWSIAVIMAAVIGRVGYLLVLKRDGLLVCAAWNRACQIAARRCPTRSIRTSWEN